METIGFTSSARTKNDVIVTNYRLNMRFLKSKRPSIKNKINFPSNYKVRLEGLRAQREGGLNSMKERGIKGEQAFPVDRASLFPPPSPVAG